MLAIAALILGIVFLGVPALQKSVHDNGRKSYAERIAATLQDFYTRNGHFPSCDPAGGVPCTALSSSDATRFLSNYAPAGTDPSSGQDYITFPVTSDSAKAQSANNNFIFYYDSSQVDHSLLPSLGQIIIDSGHWCYNSKPDTGPSSNPIASSISSPDLELNMYAILIGTEHGGYYCLDNY